jgi:protein O-GlcNAc transferase
LSLNRLKAQAASCLQQNQLKQAYKLLRQIVRKNPQDLESLLNLGSVCGALHLYREVETYSRQALHINRNLPAAWINLGYALASQSRHADAAASFRDAIRVKPDLVIAYHYLGNALRELDEREEAINVFNKALSIQPDNGPVYYDLGNTYKARGEMDKAQNCFRQSMRIRPDHLLSHTNLIACMLYDGDISPEVLFEEQRKWGSRVEGAVSTVLPCDNDPDPERVLRIGYLSPDFRKHSVAYFLRPVLEHHSRDRVLSICYSDVPEPDSTTSELRSHADKWHDISGMGNQTLYELIRADRVDILVDLAGLTNGNRLEVFARRPAPVQVNYLGYASSTGLTTIDYRLTDRFADPEGMTDSVHTEELLRLPQGFLCYQPLTDAPPVSQLPAISAGHLTFGSFNNHAKITPEVVRIWAAILKAVPESRLVCKAHRLSDSSTRRRYAGLFAENGIESERIELLGQFDSEIEHLSLYGKIDIGLDTFPYNGTATTCEALWMGVPVITLAGDRHLSRVGLSILQQVGLPDCVANTEDEYIEKAVTLGGDTAVLSSLRNSLRADMQASFLCNGQEFTGNLETAYRHMWNQWLHPG